MSAEGFVGQGKPRARNALAFFYQCVVFSTIEVLAALRLDGWLAVAVWAIAVLNVVRFVALVHGLSRIAAQALASRSETSS